MLWSQVSTPCKLAVVADTEAVAQLSYGQCGQLRHRRGTLAEAGAVVKWVLEPGTRSGAHSWFGVRVGNAPDTLLVCLPDIPPP